ncbi:high affinity copper uptake protein 1-like [Physella acuta]|uniref:high affinity copper uptake protein 1-like n=1 Tax=Physella acuta TaxID=109671 RepID=UPI0027DCD5FE|nr:high affinity copper uptake protein 1-like [Physella acuta]
MDMNMMDMPGMNMGSGAATTASTDNMDNMAGMDMGYMNDMMKSYYHLGYQEYVLFFQTRTLSVGAMIGACFIVWAIAIFYEGIKFVRELLYQNRDKNFASRKGIINQSFDDPSKSNDEKSGSSKSSLSSRRRFCDWGHFLQTFLHIIQIFVSYCLMLIVMTFNVWLCLAVFLGAGTGYFIFGWKRRDSESNEHCC